VTRAVSEVVRLDLGAFHRPADETTAGVARTDAVLAYLVRHPDGPVIFDTGMAIVDPETEAHYRPVRRSLPDALTAVGVRLDEIGLIVACHLHFDHIDGNRLLAGVPIVTQAAELREARTAPYARELIDFDGAVYQELDGDTELRPGLLIIATPGHTPGHQSLVVDTADGAVVLAGQAREQASEFAATPDERIMAQHPVEVLFAHDLAVWRA
jgi:N-acyl homoserine lactone hydrolase